MAPALDHIGNDLHITSSFTLFMTQSIFVLAYAFGPFLTGPFSEVYGRVVVLQLANMAYLIFNTACGFARTTGQLLAFRFLAGIGGRWVSKQIPVHSCCNAPQCPIHCCQWHSRRLLGS